MLILWSISVDSNFEEHIQITFHQFHRLLLYVGSLAPSHLDFGIVRFSVDIWILIQTFSIDTIA